MIDLFQNIFKSEPKVEEKVEKSDKVNDLNFKIGGEAGFGIMAAGLAFAKAANRAGLETFGYTEYPSLIRGGYNTYEVKVSEKPFFCAEKELDLLVALNKETFDRSVDTLSQGAGIIYDNEAFELKESELPDKNISLLPIPLEKLAISVGGSKLMNNTVAIGATFGMTSLEFEYFEGVLRDAFKSKGEEIINFNVKAGRAGYDFADDKFKDKYPYTLRKTEKARKAVISGNDAAALGAVAAGCKLYVSYPMTPSSTILHSLADYQIKADMVVKHAADEIEAINMAIGASYAGIRVATGTSGGGFALMAEAYGLAGIIETPLVIFEVQRPGPATGMPTWTGQGDLDFVLSAGQDEFPRIIIAPGDPKEVFEKTFEAFNLAEKYQTTVLVLTDKFLGESIQGTEILLEGLKIDRGALVSEEELSKIPEFKRYSLTESGISPRSFPGQKGGKFVANSYEHDELGFTSEKANERVEMMNKRMRKIDAIKTDLPKSALYGNENADVTIVGWGSTKGPALRAIELLGKQGISANFLHIVYLNPLPTEIGEVLKKAKKILICEGNYSGQLANLIKSKLGLDLKNRFLKFDGRPFYPEDIAEKVKEIK
jgi:2-oxoglutarate ferredoxin oxidoreductase subunit alpha